MFVISRWKSYLKAIPLISPFDNFLLLFFSVIGNNSWKNSLNMVRYVSFTVKLWNRRHFVDSCKSDTQFLLTCKAKQKRKKLKNVEQPESTLICKFGNRLNSLKMDSTSSPWLAKYLKLTPCWSKWSSLKEGQALAKLRLILKLGRLVYWL